MPGFLCFREFLPFWDTALHALRAFAAVRAFSRPWVFFLAIAPVTALVSFAVWTILTVATKYVSVGSIGGCVTLAFISTLGFFFPEHYPHDQISLGVLIVAWLVAVFVIYKHRANVTRLMNGTENGFGSKRKKV
jgi:glycerol-3-phosphate acyltransferase PlsY